jgi:hypothetical protein
MTAGRDLHDIHTVLHLIGHWNELSPVTQFYAAHRLRLLYVPITKGWPAALFYDQQGADEFLDVGPEFWAWFQPPRGRTTQRRQPRGSGRTSTRRPETQTRKE